MKSVQIGGLTPFTTIDYPGKLAAVFFLVGCPIRCAYCSNPHLLELGVGDYDPDKLIEWLKSRVGKLEAVVFSGGEALIQGDVAINYIKQVKDLGFAIGLHTNGFYPSVFERVLPLIDWVGLDFKATGANYSKLVGNNVAYELMLKSLDIWIASGKPGEVRITCDPRFIDKKDLLEIVKILSDRKVKNIAIQKYIPHFEDEANKTTALLREQFFNDTDFKTKINILIDNVVWRE